MVGRKGAKMILAVKLRKKSRARKKIGATSSPYNVSFQYPSDLRTPPCHSLGYFECQNHVDAAIDLELAHLGHAQPVHVGRKRVRIVAGDEGDADLEPAPHLPLPSLVETPQQAAAA